MDDHQRYLNISSVVGKAVFAAGKKNDFRSLERLLILGDDCHKDWKMIAMRVAAINGYVDVFRFLVDRCDVAVDIDIDSPGMTSLHLVVFQVWVNEGRQNRFLESVAYLLEKGADPNAKDYEHISVLERLLFPPTYLVHVLTPEVGRIIQMLVEGGADIDHRSHPDKLSCREMAMEYFGLDLGLAVPTPHVKVAE